MLLKSLIQFFSEILDLDHGCVKLTSASSSLSFSINTSIHVLPKHFKQREEVGESAEEPTKTNNARYHEATHGRTNN